MRKVQEKLNLRLKLPEAQKVDQIYRKQYSKLGNPEHAQKAAFHFYQLLGFDLQGITYEKNPRPGINAGGLHYDLAPGDDRILIPNQFVGTQYYLAGLVHETGHAVATLSIRQDFYPYRDSNDPVWWAESVADLLASLFLEPTSLARSGDPDLLALAKLNPQMLRLSTPMVNAMGFMIRTRFQMLAIRQAERSVLEISKQILEEWPDYFPKARNLTGMTPERMAIYFLASQLDYLITYPDIYQNYIDGALVQADILHRYLDRAQDPWQGALRLAQDLRTLFALGGSQDGEALLKHVGVDVHNKNRHVEAFSSYLGIQ